MGCIDQIVSRIGEKGVALLDTGPLGGRIGRIPVPSDQYLLRLPIPALLPCRVRPSRHSHEGRDTTTVQLELQGLWRRELWPQLPWGCLVVRCTGAWLIRAMGLQIVIRGKPSPRARQGRSMPVRWSQPPFQSSPLVTAEKQIPVGTHPSTGSTQLS